MARHGIVPAILINSLKTKGQSRDSFYLCNRSCNQNECYIQSPYADCMGRPETKKTLISLETFQYYKNTLNYFLTHEMKFLFQKFSKSFNSNQVKYTYRVNFKASEKVDNLFVHPPSCYSLPMAFEIPCFLGSFVQGG